MLPVTDAADEQVFSCSSPECRPRFRAHAEPRKLIQLIQN